MLSEASGKLTDASERVRMPYRQARGFINTWSERLEDERER
jgi:molybdenum-dependent DNA-binding transcriptional regulator ModE